MWDRQFFCFFFNLLPKKRKTNPGTCQPCDYSPQGSFASPLRLWSLPENVVYVTTLWTGNGIWNRPPDFESFGCPWVTALEVLNPPVVVVVVGAAGLKQLTHGCGGRPAGLRAAGPPRCVTGHRPNRWQGAAAPPWGKDDRFTGPAGLHRRQWLWGGAGGRAEGSTRRADRSPGCPVQPLEHLRPVPQGLHTGGWILGAGVCPHMNHEPWYTLSVLTS